MFTQVKERKHIDPQEEQKRRPRLRRYAPTVWDSQEMQNPPNTPVSEEKKQEVTVKKNRCVIL